MYNGMPVAVFQAPEQGCSDLSHLEVTAANELLICDLQQRRELIARGLLLKEDQSVMSKSGNKTQC
jgi:hypothetical protein